MCQQYCDDVRISLPLLASSSYGLVMTHNTYVPERALAEWHWYWHQQRRRNAHYITVPDTLWSRSLEFSSNKSYHYKHMAWGTRWLSWLRHCTTSRKVAGSIPDSVIGIFHWHYPFGRTMALGSTQALTEMSTRNISWGVKAAGA